MACGEEIAFSSRAADDAFFHYWRPDAPLAVARVVGLLALLARFTRLGGGPHHRP